LTSVSTATPGPCNTKTIARNFFFNGLEVATSLASTVLTTVAIARVIGPTRLGYYSLVMWMTSITCSVGSLGIPLTTFKYMGEFLGAGKKDLARAVFFHNFRVQVSVAAALSVISVLAVFAMAAPEYRACSVLLVLSIVPNMAAYIPSQANNAAENSARNARATFVSSIVYVALVAISLTRGWDLVGLAMALLVCRSVELVLKLVPVVNSMASVPMAPLPQDIRRRMFSFSGFGTGLMLLQIVVWDRSDIVFLKLLQPDIRQVAFFSVCFSAADRLLRIPQTFGTALSATQMAEYGRDKQRMVRITGESALYVLMGALPVLAGLAAVSSPLIRVVYGSQYLPAIPVFVVVALFAIPKAVLTPAQTLLYSAEELPFLLKWGCLAGAVNIGLDVALIPNHGAMGAAFANGIAQTLAATVIWCRVVFRYRVPLNSGALLRLLAAGLALVLVVLPVVATSLAPVVKLAVALPLGATTFLAAVRAMTVLQDEDRRRLLLAASSVPASLRVWCNRVIDILVPATAVVQS
jgi:O-antigen/teichoic acid export membrane protein